MVTQCINEGYTENAMHSRINALKIFYYQQVLGREKIFFGYSKTKETPATT